MDSEIKPMIDFNNEPEPIDPEVYKNLPPEVEDKMRELMARDTNMSKADAYKIVKGKAEEGDKE
jgi:hypothetical protein